jgi:hypothetical protein
MLHALLCLLRNIHYPRSSSPLCETISLVFPEFHTRPDTEFSRIIRFHPQLKTPKFHLFAKSLIHLSHPEESGC